MRGIVRLDARNQAYENVYYYTTWDYANMGVSIDLVWGRVRRSAVGRRISPVGSAIDIGLSSTYLYRLKPP